MSKYKAGEIVYFFNDLIGVVIRGPIVHDGGYTVLNIQHLHCWGNTKTVYEKDMRPYDGEQLEQITEKVRSSGLLSACETYATLEHNTFTLDGSYRGEPIIEFESQEQLEASLREGQERLFLTDWIIRIKFDSEIDAYAEVSKVTDVQSAIISIRPLDEVTSGRNTKYCAEKSLVHELLHLKLDLVDFDGNPPIEVVVFNYTQHQKVEQLAKSLIMAKYGLGFSWFKNF